MSTAHPLGVIHGRFQVLHNDHLEYILEGKRRCEHLVCGITNPDPCLTAEDSSDASRSDPRSNPLTYFERYTLVRCVLEQAGIGPQEYSVVPFPVNFPRLYSHYVPLNACFFLTIYDAWGREKLRTFRALDLSTEVLWEKDPEDKKISASTVRDRMMAEDPWMHLVPSACARLMQEWNIPDRLRHLAGLGGSRDFASHV